MTHRLSLTAALPLSLAALLAATPAHAEALSTTSIGFASRSLSYIPAKTASSTEAESDSTTGTADQEPALTDALLCQRISTPSSLGLELGAGGCLQGGGFRTFMQTTSVFVQVIYYPFTARTNVANDGALRMTRQFFGDFYLVGQGGFAKVTHKQQQDIIFTLSSDLIEFGGGVGWSYRLSRGLAIGVEGDYLVGSILSKATTGSSSTIQAMGSLTVFL